MDAFRLALVFVLFAAPPLVQAQEHWKQLDAGTTADLYAVSFNGFVTGYAVGAGGTVVKASLAGQLWTEVSIPGAGDLRGVHMFDEATVVVVGDSGAIYRTTDSGMTWTTVDSGTNEDLQFVTFEGQNGVAGGTSQTILRSEDGGASWSIVQDGFFGGGFYGGDVRGSTVMVAGQNSIFQPLVGYSSDEGETYDFTAFYLNNNEGQLEGLALVDDVNVLTAGRTFDFQGALSTSSDRGVTWTTVLVPEALFGIAVTPEAPEAFTVGADGAIYRNDGQGWVRESSGVSATLYGVDHEYFIVYVVGTSGTVLQQYLRATPAIAEGPSAEHRALDLVGPNPFRTTTTLRYQTPDGGPVDLRVYDALGREVAVLGQGVKPAGTHTATVDGSDLSPGVYVCVLRVEGVVATQSLVRLP